uniref:YycH family regulatory protein n=1 Tax=Candidatus Enterococcus willemsii TaxID=1857215 RepID=UPI00403FBE4D
MKFIERFVRIGLIAMIALSFYLTYLIWLSPANRDPGDVKEITNAELQKEKASKAASDIFLPLRLTAINGEEIRESNTENLVKKIQLELGKAKYGEAKLETFPNEEAFNEKNRLEEGIEMTYVANVPLTVYLDTFQLDIPISESIQDTNFFRIQLNYRENKIRFLNWSKRTILEAPITTSLSAIQEIVENNRSWVPVARDEMLSSYQYYTTESIKLPLYSYISSMRPYTVFRDSFFTDPKNVRSNDGSANLHLYDGSESMIIQQNQQQVDFRGILKTDDHFNVYPASYEYIRGLGTNYGSLRLFDQVNRMIDYRIFVEGFPVFGNQGEGRMTAQFLDNGQEHLQNIEIRANLSTIQVPIPSEKEVELPPSHDVIEQLYLMGADADKLQRILVGYSWKNLQDTGVVDLEPNWYVQYENKWYLSSDLFSRLQESEESSNGF